ncbi:hypothetical protein NFI96_033477, partial [Prochilodus magdalenae]
PLRNCPEVLLSPSPTVPRQGLTTITLTTPSDLTMSPPATPGKPASKQSSSHTPKTVPPFPVYKYHLHHQVFHQTIFSVGTGRFPLIGQKMRSSLLNTENSPKTERKRSTDPPLPDIIKKFRNLTDQGHVRGGKVAVDDNEREEEESPGKGKMETRVKVTDKAIVLDSKDRFNSNHLKMLSKNENFLTDENSETELGRKQADIGITSIYLDLPTHKTCLYNIPLASSNSEMEKDSQSKSAKMSVSIEETLDWAQDLHLKKRANIHIVHSEANQVWTNEKVKGNAEMEAVHVVEIPRKNGKRFLAEMNDVEVKIMEESAVVAADHGEEAHTSDSTTDKTDVEGGLSSFAMTNRESVAYEEELRGPQLLRTVVELVSSDEADMDPMKAQQLAAELEVEMMADMYNRMTNACHRKCVPPHYKEAELSKGEAVCLDRCVAKYLDLHERLGRKLTELSVQDEEMMRKAATGTG